MRLMMIAACLAATPLVAPDGAEAQVTDVAKQIPNEREYWEDRRFGADEFWRDYTRWYSDRPVATYDDRTAAVFGIRPYYERPVYERPVYRDVDAEYVNPRLRGYNPRLRDVDPRGVPYSVRRPYTAHERRLLEENDYLVPDSFEPMDEDVRRWPAHYRDYHDFYQDGGYRSSGYFYPASGLGPRPVRYWR